MLVKKETLLREYKYSYFTNIFNLQIRYDQIQYVFSSIFRFLPSLK